MGSGLVEQSTRLRILGSGSLPGVNCSIRTPSLDFHGGELNQQFRLFGILRYILYVQGWRDTESTICCGADRNCNADNQRTEIFRRKGGPDSPGGGRYPGEFLQKPALRQLRRSGPVDHPPGRHRWRQGAGRLRTYLSQRHDPAAALPRLWRVASNRRSRATLAILEERSRF
jgi:hypothetical protein